MNPLALETMSMRPAADPAAKERQRAEQVADQFEELFVRTMVGSLRQTSSIGGDGGGMFGDGPGADTYADWFDQNLAHQITKSSRIGIKQQLMADFERTGEVAAPASRVDEATRKLRAAAEDRAALGAARRMPTGGADVVL